MKKKRRKQCEFFGLKKKKNLIAGEKCKLEYWRNLRSLIILYGNFSSCNMENFLHYFTWVNLNETKIELCELSLRCTNNNKLSTQIWRKLVIFRHTYRFTERKPFYPPNFHISFFSDKFISTQKLGARLLECQVST